MDGEITVAQIIRKIFASIIMNIIEIFFIGWVAMVCYNNWISPITNFVLPYISCVGIGIVIAVIERLMDIPTDTSADTATEVIVIKTSKMIRIAFFLMVSEIIWAIII